MNCSKCGYGMSIDFKLNVMACNKCGYTITATGIDKKSAPVQEWKLPKCECGAEGMGVKNHSQWCPKAEH